jgi:hypothetical protein
LKNSQDTFMRTSNTTKFIAACATFYWPNGIFAHENHGMQGAHWHATDAWGFVALGAMVALAIWLSRGGK